jgi:two-component SAPR family response regulator
MGVSLAPTVQVDVQEAISLGARLLAGTVDLQTSPVSIEAFADDLLPDWYDEWVVIERERFRQLRMHALEALCMQLTHAERHAEAVLAGLAAVACEPLRESAHRALIRAYVSERNFTEALHQVMAYRTVLRDEMGVDPSEAFDALLRTFPDSRTP